MLTFTTPSAKRLFNLLASRWDDCRDCPLHKTRTQLVHARGQMPADVLYIGEAPGEIEDTLGEPFIGPAGKHLDKILARVPSHTYCIINVVACWPKDPTGKTRAPVFDERQKCTMRVTELYRLAHPSKIVLLGKTAEMGWRETKINFPSNKTLILPHPSNLLRGDKGPGHSDFERCVLQLTQFLTA